MNGSGNGQSIPFAVSMSAATKEVLFDLHEQAIQRGRGQQFVAAFRQILHRLKTDPLVFGEALYRLQALQLAVRQGGISMLVVDYGVHEVKRLVLIRGFKLLSLS